MHRVPQANLLNPAIEPTCDWVVGIPGLSSAHLSYSNTGFTYNDLAGSDTWNIERVAEQLHRVDMIATEAMVHPIYLGHRFGSLYFTLLVADRAHFYQTIPGTLVETAVYGNGPFVGETVDYDALRTGGYYQREYALSATRRMSPYLTAGIRARLLFGKASIQTANSDLNLTTGPGSFNLLLSSDYLVNTSLPVTFTEDDNGDVNGVELDDLDVVQFLLNRKNPGISIDLGMIYDLSSETSLSASLLDLGLTRWSSDLNNVSGEGSFTYTGIDPGTDVISFAFINEIRDSLINSFDISAAQESYTYVYPAQLYLGVSHRLHDRLTAGVVNRNVLFKKKLHSSVTLTAQRTFLKGFMAAFSWSYLNNSVKNVGAALAYTGKGFQFHVSSDNLLGFFYPFNTRTAQIRAGCNIVFGCGGQRKKRNRSPSYGNLPGAGDCSWNGGRKNYQREMEKAAGVQEKMNKDPDRR